MLFPRVFHFFTGGFFTWLELPGEIRAVRALRACRAACIYRIFAGIVSGFGVSRLCIGTCVPWGILLVQSFTRGRITARGKV